MMSRAVGLILTLAFSLLSGSLAADAQPPTKIPRIDVLVPAEPPSPVEPNIAAFCHALQNLGYVDSQTVAVEYRYALGKVERIPDLVAELVRLQVDILVVGSRAAAVVAKNASQTIPIVFIGGFDPVESGLVARLARPGGNLTGLSFAFSEGFGGKWVELLVEAVPGAARIALLRHALSAPSATYEKDIPMAAQALGLTLQVIRVNEAEEGLRPRQIDRADSGLASHALYC